MKKRHTARDIPRLGKGIHCFDPTLYLRVTARGTRAWVQRIVIRGKQVDRGLGGWPLVTLEEARLEALANRRAARTGRDPFAEAAAARAAETAEAAPGRTFREAADECRADHLDGWSKASVIQWDSMIRAHLGPIMDAPLGELTRRRIIGLLQNKTPVTAKRARGVIKMVFETAVAAEWCEHNPALGIEAKLPKQKAEDVKHHAAADCKAAPSIFKRLADTGTTAADALAWIMVTACRSAEGRAATWAEIDTDARTWTVGAERMKKGRAHVVPLPDAALAILERRAADTGRNGLVFPSVKRGRPVADTTVAGLLKDDGVTVHGMRSCFADWAADRGVQKEVYQNALAHRSANGTATERAYARTTRLDDRRALMNDWGAHLQSAP